MTSTGRTFYVRRPVFVESDVEAEDVTRAVFEAVVRDRISRFNLTPADRRSLASDVADLVYGPPLELADDG